MRPSGLKSTNMPIETPNPTTSHKQQDDQPKPNRLTKSKRELFFHHESVTESLAGKDVQYKKASLQATQSANELKSAEETLEKLQKTEEEVKDKLHTLHGRKLRNKFFPKKAETEESKLREHLSELASTSETTKDEICRAKEKAAQDAAVCDGLRADAKQLKISERTKRDILEKVFGGMDAGSPAENEIESERDRLARATDRERDRLAEQKQALMLLKQAGLDLVNARKHLAEALTTNTIDLFTGGPIGFTAGVGSQYHVTFAAELAKDAGRKIERAMELNERLPKLELAKVQNGVALAFADIVFDGIVTDVIIRITIQKAVKSVDEGLLAMRDVVFEQMRVVAQLDDRVKRYSTDLKRKSDDLVRVRAQLLRNSSF